MRKRNILTITMIIICIALMNPFVAGESTSQRIKLPEPKYDSNTSVEKALLERRSIRDYKKESLTMYEVSQLLWAAQGITDSDGFRTVPSAGALYPLELYAVAGNVKDIPQGVYKYHPRKHELLRIVDGDKRSELCKAALGQSPIQDAPFTIVFSALYERTTGKYGDRGIRYVHMEVGHAAQNVCLQAISLNIGSVVIGAFDDDKVRKVVNMESKERPLSIVVVGKSNP